MLVHQGVLKTGIAFIQKPFRLEALVHKVREVLDATQEVSHSPLEMATSRIFHPKPISGKSFCSIFFDNKIRNHAIFPGNLI